MKSGSSGGVEIARDFVLGGALTAGVAYVAKHVSPEWGAFVDAVPVGVIITLIAVYLSGVSAQHMQTFATQDAIARGTHAVFAAVVGVAMATGLGLWKAFGWASAAWILVVSAWIGFYFLTRES